jgi:hypothetical protein
MHEGLIKELEALRMGFFDEESSLLGRISKWHDDPVGDNMRRIAELREKMALMDRSIKMLKESK